MGKLKGEISHLINALDTDRNSKFISSFGLAREADDIENLQNLRDLISVDHFFRNISAARTKMLEVIRDAFTDSEPNAGKSALLDLSNEVAELEKSERNLINDRDAQRKHFKISLVVNIGFGLLTAAAFAEQVFNISEFFGSKG
jgi:hypothetical protein